MTIGPPLKNSANRMTLYLPCVQIKDEDFSSISAFCRPMQYDLEALAEISNLKIMVTLYRIYRVISNLHKEAVIAYVMTAISDN